MSAQPEATRQTVVRGGLEPVAAQGSAGEGAPRSAACPQLDVQHLQKRYAGRQVVRDVSFAGRCGEVVGLLGPNGAGKTTSFYMIVGLVRPDAGRIHIDGQDGVSPEHLVFEASDENGRTVRFP